MTENIHISTEGTFTLEELEMITQCLRDIEQRDTTRHISVFIDVPDKTVEEMEKINNLIQPELPFKLVLKNNICSHDVIDEIWDEKDDTI